MESRPFALRLRCDKTHRPGGGAGPLQTTSTSPCYSPKKTTCIGFGFLFGVIAFFWVFHGLRVAWGLLRFLGLKILRRRMRIARGFRWFLRLAMRKKNCLGRWLHSPRLTIPTWKLSRLTTGRRIPRGEFWMSSRCARTISRRACDRATVRAGWASRMRLQKAYREFERENGCCLRMRMCGLRRMHCGER